ncbi:MAG: T9SS type A sorting domain-containing protein [Gemmatimonadetes bacterium]|nr:T9SS type A sorting domain-containing protein [Gemmatimonadota bacterium]MYK41583.1 T9SS type A sorting domain-containing protein [Gemmatimonadota bacterium]
MILNRRYRILLAACVAGWCSAGLTEAGYIPNVPYFHQHSNRINPSGSCQNTSVAIVLKYYGADDITPDMISAKWGTHVAQTTGGLEKVFNEEAALRGLSVRDQATETGLLRELHALLDAGRPVIVHGGFSTVGHLMVLVGYDERFYYAMDPASQWTERLNGGFTNTDDPHIGRYTRYGRDAVENAIISRGFIRMHQIYFAPGPLAAEWEGSFSDSVAVGAAVEFAGGIRIRDMLANGEDLHVSADLSALGGRSDQVLTEASPGFYPFAETLAASGSAGRKTVVFHIRQGEAAVEVKRTVVLMPVENQVVFDEGLGAGWHVGFTTGAELAVSAGEPLTVETRGFTLELLPSAPIEPVGYRALRFSFHPGDATVGLRGAFSVQLNENPRKIEPLIDGFFRGIDMERAEWQTVEVPLWAFAPLEEPIESIRFFGNLRGTFYLDDIELVSALFPPPRLVADWQSALPDSALAGAELVLREHLRVTSPMSDGPVPEVFADLSELGGDTELALERVGAGLYQLMGTLSADVSNGLKSVRIHLRQGTPDGPLETTLVRELVVLPAADQVIFADQYGENWTQGFISNVEVDEQVFEGTWVQTLVAEAFTLEYKPLTPVEPVGYRALRLTFHPGDTEGDARPVFNVVVNRDTPSLVALFEGEGLELARQEWQVIEIPLERFFRLDGPIESIRLFGNLRGTFYLGDVRLVAARTSAPTAVLQQQHGVVPEAFSIAQNYPNPFNSTTAIGFALPRAGAIQLAVFNALGQQVAVLAEGTHPAGSYTLRWDGVNDSGRALAAGLYFYRLQTPWGVQTRKLLLLK